MDPSSPDPLLDLVRRWSAGDREALGQILLDVEPWLHREVSHAMRGHPMNGQDSADLTQQAVLNFLQTGPRFVPQSGAQFRALLRRIAMNELIDQGRRAGRRGTRHLESMAGSGSMSGFGGAGPSQFRPSVAAELAEESNWVRLALQYLEPEERRLLVASEVDCLDWSTIAEELGLSSPDAARVKAARLKPKLANVLRKLKSGQVPETR